MIYPFPTRTLTIATCLFVASLLTIAAPIYITIQSTHKTIEPPMPVRRIK